MHGNMLLMLISFVSLAMIWQLLLFCYYRSKYSFLTMCCIPLVHTCSWLDLAHHHWGHVPSPTRIWIYADLSWSSIHVWRIWACYGNSAVLQTALVRRGSVLSLWVQLGIELVFCLGEELVYSLSVNMSILEMLRGCVDDVDGWLVDGCWCDLDEKCTQLNRSWMIHTVWC